MALQSINGILLVNKPLNSSSNFVLQKVLRMFQAKKAGHTGSLDPLATGMLPICFGDATKFCQFMLDADKEYTAVGILGKNTTTQDAEGEVIKTRCAERITEEKLRQALFEFTGEIMQVPSMYSALKKNGVPLYKLARKGIEVERKPRPVTIHELNLLSFNSPYFKIKVVCSKGTYIRNLVEDIGNYLEVGAYVDQLHRDFAYPFSKQRMYTLAELEAIEDKLSLLHPIEAMVVGLPRVDINVEQRQALYYGQIIESDSPLEKNKLYQLFTEGTEYIGLGEAIDSSHLKSRRLTAA